MRTTVETDDDLIAAAMEATGLTKKEAAVDGALRRLILGYRKRAALDDAVGRGWVGDLATLREGRVANEGDDPASTTVKTMSS